MPSSRNAQTDSNESLYLRSQKVPINLWSIRSTFNDLYFQLYCHYHAKITFPVTQPKLSFFLMIQRKKKTLTRCSKCLSRIKFCVAGKEKLAWATQRRP